MLHFQSTYMTSLILDILSKSEGGLLIMIQIIVSQTLQTHIQTHPPPHTHKHTHTHTHTHSHTHTYTYEVVFGESDIWQRNWGHELYPTFTVCIHTMSPETLQ